MTHEGEMSRRRGVSNKRAVGAYFRRLRERRGLTQAEVLDYVHALANWPMDESTLIRIESGQSFAGGEIIMALVNILEASPRDIFHLQRDLKAEKADGIAVANAHADRTPEATAEAKRVPSMLARIIEIGESDPEKMIRVVSAIRDDARVDAALLDNILAFLAGRRSLKP